MLSDNTVFLRAVGSLAWVLTRFDVWSWSQRLIFCGVVFAGLEILAALVNLMHMTTSKRIPKRGHHLDNLGQKDYLFITISKFSTVMFTYHLLQYAGNSEHIVWSLDGLTLSNTLLVFPLFFIIYDFFYTAWHRFLHIPAIYPYIHKHHHHQHAPSRGNLDAINVHPVEFIVGEYDHLLTIFLVARYIAPVHVLSILAFILLGGFLASLNHTRFDLSSPLIPQLYSVKYHDLHHWDPNWNFGQYIMLWDYLTKSFKPWPELRSSPSHSPKNN